MQPVSFGTHSPIVRTMYAIAKTNGGGPIKYGQWINAITDELKETLTSVHRAATGSTST